MSELETRMSRLHGKKSGKRGTNHAHDYEEYLRGESASQPAPDQDWPALPEQQEVQDWDQTQVYRTDEWASEDPYAYHEVTELPDEDSRDAYYDQGRAVAEEAYRPQPVPVPAKPQGKGKRPYSQRLDRFLNNALILVAVLLLIVLVIMFVF